MIIGLITRELRTSLLLSRYLFSMLNNILSSLLCYYILRVCTSLFYSKNRSIFTKNTSLLYIRVYTRAKNLHIPNAYINFAPFFGFFGSVLVIKILTKGTF